MCQLSPLYFINLYLCASRFSVGNWTSYCPSRLQIMSYTKFGCVINRKTKYRLVCISTGHSIFNKRWHKGDTGEAFLMRMTNIYYLIGDIYHLNIFFKPSAFRPACLLLGIAFKMSNVKYWFLRIFWRFNQPWYTAYCSKESLKMQFEKKTLTTFVKKNSFTVSACNRRKWHDFDGCIVLNLQL